PPFFVDSHSRQDGKYRLQAEPSVTCYEGNWYNYLPLAVFSLLVHVISLPLGLSYILYKAKTKRDDPVFAARFGYLYLRYKENLHWWELIIFLRKFTVLALVVFLIPYPHLAAGLLMPIFFVCFMIQLTVKPYTKMNYNILEASLLLLDYALLSIG